MSFCLLTAETIPEGWFEPDPPRNRRARTTFKRRGFYYGTAWRTIHWGYGRGSRRLNVRTRFHPVGSCHVGAYVRGES